MDQRRCSVCDEGDLRVLRIGGLQRTFCVRCHHSERVDGPSFDYTGFAMGGTAVAHDRLESQAAFLWPHLPANAAALEIGCAAGDLARVLRAGHTFRRYDGVELSPARTKAAAVLDRVFDLDLTQLLNRGLVAEGSCDVVLTSHCLEHLWDVHGQVAAIKRALSVDGRGVVFIEVPNRSGNPRLPFDNNRAHIHFFSMGSLTRLLAAHGLEVIATQTGAWYDARYPDSIRVVARPFVLPAVEASGLLSDHATLAGVDRVVVWGAGKMVDEVLAHYFDPRRIAFFVDSDARTHGSVRLGVPVRPPQFLAQEPGHVVLIGSLEYEIPIRRQIAEQFGASVRKVIGIGELLGP